MVVRAPKEASHERWCGLEKPIVERYFAILPCFPMRRANAFLDRIIDAVSMPSASRILLTWAKSCFAFIFNCITK